MDLCSDPFLARRPDLSAVILDDLLYDGKSDAASALAGISRRISPIEQDDLKKLAEKVNGGEAYEGKHFKLTANIDLKNEEWTPIGTLQGEEVRRGQGTFGGDG